MENYIKKAADAFLVERPYGMRVDYRKKGFVLFNRNLNVLKVSEKDTFFFVMLPVHYPFLFLNHLWSSQLSLFEKPSYRNK